MLTLLYLTIGAAQYRTRPWDLVRSNNFIGLQTLRDLSANLYSQPSVTVKQSRREIRDVCGRETYLTSNPSSRRRPFPISSTIVSIYQSRSNLIIIVAFVFLTFVSSLDVFGNRINLRRCEFEATRN